MTETLLWQLGSVDHDSSEFALFGNPEAAAQFGEVDFVVGKSDAKLDWPYVQPGPADEWGGNREHVYRLRFNSDTLTGACKLVLHVVDVNPEVGATLAIRINQVEATAALPPGHSYESLNTSSCEGAFSFEVPVASSLLSAGDSDKRAFRNLIELRTIAGGYLIYDSIEFLHLPDELPDGDLHEVTAQALPFLANRDGAITQPVEVMIDNWGRGRSGALEMQIADGLVSQPAAVPFGRSLHSFNIPALGEPADATLRFVNDDNEVCAREMQLQPARRWNLYLAPHRGIAQEFFGLDINVEAVFQNLKLHLPQIHNAQYPFDAILLDVLTDNNERVLRVVEDWKSYWEYPRFLVGEGHDFFAYIAEKYGEESLTAFGDLAKKELNA